MFHKNAEPATAQKPFSDHWNQSSYKIGFWWTFFPWDDCQKHLTLLTVLNVLYVASACDRASTAAGTNQRLPTVVLSRQCLLCLKTTQWVKCAVSGAWFFQFANLQYLFSHQTLSELNKCSSIILEKITKLTMNLP